MYGSFRFYFDDIPELIQGQHILDIFALFSKELGREYDHFSYMLWSPDENNILIDKSFPNTATGKAKFLNEQIIPIVTGQNGDMTAPVISALCKCNEMQLYSGLRVQIQFPVYSMPLTICVDLEQRATNKVSFENYIHLICGLQSLGFGVNNGFYHVYSLKNEAETLNGGQIGPFLSHCGHKNLKQSIQHKGKGCLNHVMGVYFMNTIRSDLLRDGTRNRLAAITDNIIISGNVLSFALSGSENVSPIYWIKHRQIIKMLEEELRYNM